MKSNPEYWNISLFEVFILLTSIFLETISAYFGPKITHLKFCNWVARRGKISLNKIPYFNE